MEEKDLKQIKEIVETAVKTGLGEFLEGNLEPALDGVHQGISGAAERLTIVDRKLDKALYMETERIGRLERT